MCDIYSEFVLSNVWPHIDYRGIEMVSVQKACCGFNADIVIGIKIRKKRLATINNDKNNCSNYNNN